MSAVSAAMVSPVVSAPRASEGTPAASEAPEQAFGQVLAREVDRQDGNASAQSDAAETDVPATPETSADDLAQAQQTVASPWLLMLQQLAPGAVVPSPVQPLRVAFGDRADNPDLLLQSMQQSGALVAGMMAKPQLASVSSGVLEEPLVVAQGVLPSVGSDSVLLALAATATAEAGKDLPQAVAEAGNGTIFANMLAGQLDDAVDANRLQGAMNGQIQSAMPMLDRATSSENIQTLQQRTISEPVGNARWGDAVAQQVSMMLGKHEQQMEMQLNPPHLGPMEVRLTMGADQASVMFTSQNAAVREALAAATPRLTALLADQGIQLVNVQVASDSLNQQAQDQSRQQAASQDRGEQRRESSGFESENPSARRVLTGINMPVARSGVSLYV